MCSRSSDRACCIQRPSDPSPRVLLRLALRPVSSVPRIPLRGSISLLSDGWSEGRGRWCIIVRRGRPWVSHRVTAGASSSGVSRSSHCSFRRGGPGNSPSAGDAISVVPQSECEAAGIEAAVVATKGVLHDLCSPCAQAQASRERCGQAGWCKLCRSDRSSRCSGSGSGHSNGSDRPHAEGCSASG